MDWSLEADQIEGTTPINVVTRLIFLLAFNNFGLHFSSSM